MVHQTGLFRITAGLETCVFSFPPQYYFPVHVPLNKRIVTRNRKKKKKHSVKEGIQELTGHAGRFFQGWFLSASRLFVSTNNCCVPDLFKPLNIFVLI